MNNPYSLQYPQSSFVVRNGSVYITQYSGRKIVREVVVPVGEFVKAAQIIVPREEEK